MSLSGDLVIFIDAENASPKWGVPLYVWLCQNFSVRECYCVGNRKSVGDEYLRLEGPKFHLVNSDLGKDSADTWLVMLGSRELCLRRSVKKIAILSNDRDFAPLAYLAAEREKKLIIYAAKNAGTQGLQQTIQRLETGEAASVEAIELDKLVGRQLEKPNESLGTKLLTGAKNLMKLPQKLWHKEQEGEKPLPNAHVMATHEMAPKKTRKARAAKKPAPQPVKKPAKAKGKSGEKRPLALAFSQPGGESERLFKNLPVSVHNYLVRRREKIKLLLALGQEGDFLEIPFVEGMASGMFLEILINYKVIKGGNVEEDFYRSLGLVCRGQTVYYDREGLEAEADEA